MGIERQVREHGSVCLRVQGMSMFPWIRPGDHVFVRRSEFLAAQPGDVVLFAQNGHYFVHRVLRRGKTCGHAALLTKGDALDGSDAPVLEEHFLGCAIRVHRRRRHIDLQSLGYVVLGRLIARLSPVSSLLYKPLRVGRRLLTEPESI